jgi:hypothetical protein
MLACNSAIGAGSAGRGPDPVTSPEFQLSVEQRQFFTRPVAAEARVGRPATPQDLREVQDWFAPGELQALLVVANQRAVARGDDTLAHCIPLCGRPAAIDP